MLVLTEATGPPTEAGGTATTRYYVGGNNKNMIEGTIYNTVNNHHNQCKT